MAEMTGEYFIDKRFLKRSEGEHLKQILRNEISNAARLFARHSLDATGFNVSLNEVRSDMAVARAINKNVKVLDPYLTGPETTNEDKEILTIGMAEAAKSESPSIKIKRILSDFANRFLDNTVDVVTGIGGSKTTRLAAELTLIATTACAPIAAATPVIIQENLSKSPITLATPTPLVEVHFSPTETPTQMPADTFHKFEGHTHMFDPEMQTVVNEVEAKNNIIITMPLDYDGKENLPWTDEELIRLFDALSNLPPTYVNDVRAPKEIILLREPGKTNEGTGGDYTSGRLIIRISEAFNPDLPFNNTAYKDIYKTNGVQLEATVLHEWSHAFLLAHPEVFDNWVEQMGWLLVKDVQGKDLWVNSNVDELTKLPYGNMYPPNPYEDFSVSVGQMLANPSSLPADRAEFLSKLFLGWNSVEPFLGN